MRRSKCQPWDKKMVHQEGGNLGQNFLNLSKLFNLLLLVGLAKKCSGTFPGRPSCMNWPLLPCMTLHITLGAGRGLFASKLTLGHNFPAKKSGHSGVSLQF